ncbi:MFS transporter [Streptosporangium sp. NPDC000396]|uniref:MFS transporter n=1 Tax=Streptosporangium sp. NPDC000396 TaxID=3366185 RepID=UPI0036C6717A
MFVRAYEGQCAAEEKRRTSAEKPAVNPRLALFALALGTFAIGTGEFGSNGIIQLFAADLDVSIPVATYAITAYAFGVVIGSPLITLLAARVNRRTLLLGLVVLFLVGNGLSALAPNIVLLVVFRFVAGSVQGAFFGAGAVVAAYVYGPGKGGKAFATVMGGLTVATIAGSPLGTFIGQHAGWRVMYWTVVAVGLLAGIALVAWLPRTDDLHGSPVRSELNGLRRINVWLMVAVASLGISSIFAVYTFIGPFVTDAARRDAALIPVALAVFGLGMAVGNHLGGRVADRYEHRGLIWGYGGVLALLVLIGVAGSDLLVLLPCLFGVGATMMFAIPTIQVRLTGFAPDAPTLMGALNLAALNLANSLGAIGGAVTLEAGWGTLSTVWAGFVLTSAGLLLYVVTVARPKRHRPARRGPVLDDEQFRRLAGYGEEEHVEAGRNLYTSGDDSYDFFLLRTATVDIIRDVTAIEPERLIYRGGPGDFLGELNLLTGQQVYLTARVTSAGTVVRIGAARLRRALAEQDDIAGLMLAAFQERREVFRAAAGGTLEIVGRPDSAETLELRGYVTQMLLPHTWRSATSPPGRSLMTSAGLTEADLPAAIANGSVVRRATPGTVAQTLGLTYRDGGGPVDLVVVGAGPAGLAAAVYGASEGLVTVLLDRSGLGGQAAKSARIENYLGFPDGISGVNLTRLAMVQALKFGVRIHSPCVVKGLDLSDERRPVVVLEDGARVECRAVIAATGVRYRRLDIPGWAAFEQSGCIRYAATEPDVRGYEGRPVTVVGGANSAGQAALSLAARGATVDLVVRGHDLAARMSSYLTDRIQANSRIRVHTGSTVSELAGDDTLTSVVVERSGERPACLASRALFCFVGADPVSGWLTGVAKAENGFVLTDVGLPAGSTLPYQTSAPRVFAVGDLRSGSTKRVATAVGDGASAVSSVHAALAGD